MLIVISLNELSKFGTFFSHQCFRPPFRYGWMVRMLTGSECLVTVWKRGERGERTDLFFDNTLVASCVGYVRWGGRYGGYFIFSISNQMLFPLLKYYLFEGCILNQN